MSKWLFSDQLVDPQFTAPCLSVHRSLYGVAADMWLYYKSVFLGTSPPVPQTPLFGRGTAKQTKVTLSVLSCLKCGTLTTFEKMPNSIIFGVYCHPAATKSSTDITSNLIPLPDGSDPGLKSHCSLKDKPRLTLFGPINIQDMLFESLIKAGRSSTAPLRAIKASRFPAGVH